MHASFKSLDSESFAIRGKEKPMRENIGIGGAKRICCTPNYFAVGKEIISNMKHFFISL